MIIVYICHKTSISIKKHDHSSIVLDEFIGMWITLTIISSHHWFKLLLGFLFFRFFDILKPWPISWIDKKISGGIGIVLDDIFSGILSGFFIYAVFNIC